MQCALLRQYADSGTHLTWIAEEALHAPLPPHWSSHRDDTGDVYFVRSVVALLCRAVSLTPMLPAKRKQYSAKLDKSTYEHPLVRTLSRGIPSVLI